MAGVLLFRGKGIDLVGVMNVYAIAAGAVLAQEPGIRDVRVSPRRSATRQATAPAQCGRLARKAGIDPNSVTWVNIDANAKLGALKAKTVDATTSFFNLHTCSRAARARHGIPGEGCRRICTDSIIANGWLKPTATRPTNS